MNKTLVSIAVIAVIIGGFFYFQSASAPTEEHGVTNENQESMESPTETPDENVSGLIFELSGESKMSYVAQKKFFEKPTQEVVGTSDEVEGNIRFDEETNELFVNARIVSDFVSDSKMRDNDVKKLIPEDIVVTSNAIALPNGLVDGETVSMDDVELLITINGTTKPVTFSVEGTRNGDTITAHGSGTLSLADFNVTAPSMLSIYEVDDAMGLTFDLTATRQ